MRNCCFCRSATAEHRQLHVARPDSRPAAIENKSQALIRLGCPHPPWHPPGGRGWPRRGLPGVGWWKDSGGVSPRHRDPHDAQQMTSQLMLPVHPSPRVLGHSCSVRTGPKPRQRPRPHTLPLPRDGRTRAAKEGPPRPLGPPAQIPPPASRCLGGKEILPRGEGGLCQRRPQYLISTVGR